MKNTSRFLLPMSALVGAFVLLAPLTALARPLSTLVAFRSTAPGIKGRHISVESGGGLMLGSTILGGKQAFTLIDLNGGKLVDGDAVQISYNSGKRPSYWRENAGRIARTGDKPDKNCIFKVKWKQPAKIISLRAPSGKWVSGPAKGAAMTTIGAAKSPTLGFELLKNPKIVAEPPRKQ